MNRVLKLMIGFVWLVVPSFHAAANELPTVLDSETQAQELLNQLERGFLERILFFPKPSQCTARATTWAFQMDRDFGVKSQKIFLFFDPQYRTQFKHKWWFHVAPLVWVRTATGQVEERVIDPSFSSRPLPVKNWTDLFLKNHPHCKDESDYGYPGTGYCHVNRASMYAHFPMDLESGSLINYWRPETLETAFSYLRPSAKRRLKVE